MTAWFLPGNSLGLMLEQVLSGCQVYGIRSTDGQMRLAPTAPAQIALPPCRATDPLKALLFRPREDVGSPDEPVAADRAVVGVASCDLAALRILDYVFLGGDVSDPGYKALRERTLLVSVDCSAPKDVCFCTFLQGAPFPAGGYDLNLSPLSDGFLVEAGSARGTALLDRARALLAEASPEHLEARDRARAAARAKVDRNVAEAGLHAVSDLQERVRNSRSNPLWERLAQECVECAACNFICPTCHCFLLVDVEERQGFRRFKDWDACLYRGFAVEAAGANPRPRRADRLHGRLEKKFDFLVANAGTWGCVGCGRCIEACAGRIDLRETLRELIHA